MLRMRDRHTLPHRKLFNAAILDKLCDDFGGSGQGRKASLASLVLMLFLVCVASLLFAIGVGVVLVWLVFFLMRGHALELGEDARLFLLRRFFGSFVGF